MHLIVSLEKFLTLISKTLRQTSVFLILFYQEFLSYIFGVNCRFYPSCSCYAREAFERHNFLYALLIVFKRIITCHPFGRQGYDPVPEVKFNV